MPEELTVGRIQFFDARNVLPIELVNAFDAGRTANGGSPPAEVLGFPNPRREGPPGTISTYLRTENIKNVVSIAGDVHAHFAGCRTSNRARGAARPCSRHAATGDCSRRWRATTASTRRSSSRSSARSGASR